MRGAARFSRQQCGPFRSRWTESRGFTQRRQGAKIFASPRLGVKFVPGCAALRSLVAAGKIGKAERTAIFNTGSGIKYLECYER
jgi:hypothetical protein